MSGEHSANQSREPDINRGHASSKERIVDFDGALRRLDGNRRLLREMITFFREDVPELLDELQVALRARDQAQVKRTAHSIKGLASNFGAERVMQLSRTIELFADANELDRATPCVEPLEQAVAELDQVLKDFKLE